VNWIGLAEDRGQVVGCCEGDDKPLGSLKCGEFLDQQSNYYVPLHAVSYFQKSRTKRNNRKVR
jgi:hypothetical protein